MPDPSSRSGSILTSPWPDVALAMAGGASAFAFYAVDGQLRWAIWPLLVSTFVSFLALPARRRLPVAAAAVAAAAALLPGLIGPVRQMENLPDIAFGIAFFFAYSVGSRSTIPLGVASVLALIAGMQIGRVFNPFIEIITIGPWLAGQVVASRQRIVSRVEARNRELAEEKERFAREAVRYERARIARELHDIVAHSVSAIVVQAGAGQRLAGRDSELASKALDMIAEMADSARDEIDRLVDLLSTDIGDRARSEDDFIGDLARRAAATGLAVDFKFSVDYHMLAPAAREALYRVVQESLTNAIKHAPGAAVRISLDEEQGGVRVKVLNDPPTVTESGLESSGGGNGLGGMRDRVEAAGGRFSAGAQVDGGWTVEALLPTPFRSVVRT